VGLGSGRGERRLRVAIVGPGGWGRQHVRVFGGRADTEIVALVGRDANTTAALAAQARTAPFTDIDQMLKQVQPDLVTIALPNEHHFDLTLKAVRAGVAVLVEKPLVFNLQEADLLLKEAERQKLFFAIDFNHRYAEPVLRAKAAISAGRLGELIFVSWRFGGEPNPKSTHPHAMLIETQCHGFDMLEHLAGPIASVMAQMSNRSHGSYSTVAISVEFANGAVGSLIGSYDSSYAYPLAQLVEVNGTAGRLLIEDTVRRLTISRSGDESREVWEAGYFNDQARGFHQTFDRHMDELVPALAAGAEPPIHARAGRRALVLAYACIESFETGGRVST
jgi:predicted dehydrogenase